MRTYWNHTDSRGTVVHGSAVRDGSVIYDGSNNAFLSVTHYAEKGSKAKAFGSVYSYLYNGDNYCRLYFNVLQNILI